MMELQLFLAPSGVSGLEVIAAFFMKPIRQKIIFAQKHLSRTINFRFSLSLFSIRTLVVAIANTVITRTPFLRKANKNVLIFSPRCANMSGLPRFSAEISLGDDKSIVFYFKFVWYLSRKVLAVPSF